MPLYEYQCPDCGLVAELQLPLVKCDETVYCDKCFTPMNKLFNKLTTVWREKDRKWGTSFYRKQGEKIKAPKMPGFIPKEIK